MVRRQAYLRRSDPDSVSSVLYSARRNLQVFIEMLPPDPSLTIVDPLLALLMDLRLLDRRVRNEFSKEVKLTDMARKVVIMHRATAILNDRYHRDMIDDPAAELLRMRLFVAEMDSDITSRTSGGS